MIKFFTTLVFIFCSVIVISQTQPQIPNGGFENWENVGSSTEEPTSWNSNKTGSGLASTGPQTCYRETGGHSGTYCVRVETKYYILAVVNGNVTTGVVNAPSSNKAEGFISATGANKIAFTGRPDSLVGWYKYTQATGGTGASAEQGKVLAILHTGDFYDPEAPVNGNHPDLSGNKIGDALFVSPASNTTTWKRFSIPFTYASASNPDFILLNVTSSNNQTTVAPNSGSTGSKLWLDDLEVIYNASIPSSVNETKKSSFKIYTHDNTIYADLSKINEAATLNLFDLTGKLVMQTSLEKNEVNSIKLSNAINAGLYFYQVNINDQIISGKLIKN
jgi:hypothetical protein